MWLPTTLLSGRRLPRGNAAEAGAITEELPLGIENRFHRTAARQGAPVLAEDAEANVVALAAKGHVAVGRDADLTLVDLGAKRRIEGDWIASRCGWTPFEGMAVTGWPAATIVRGHVVMREGELLGAPVGAPVRFTECL